MDKRHGNVIKTGCSIPQWPTELNMQHCHCSGSGHCCGVGLIPGLGTQPKKKPPVYSNGQQPYEKAPIISHQGKTNLNPSLIPLYTHQSGCN